MSDSIAILSDAAHLISDVFGLGVSVICMKIGMKAANETYTYGYHRAEIIGALASIFTIWIMTGALIYEATNRLYNKPEIVG